MNGHDEENCPNCVECLGCDGGSGVIPVNYRAVPFPGGKYARLRCADCDGQGLVCDCKCHLAANVEALIKTFDVAQPGIAAQLRALLAKDSA